MEEKKLSGMREFAGAEELKMEDLFEVTGGLTKEGIDLIRRNARQFKREGRSKEEFMHIFDNLSYLSIWHLETSKRELEVYMNRIWEETNV